MAPPIPIAMPPGVSLYNASGYPCNMAQGHCCCGAHHTVKETVDRLKATIGMQYMAEEQRQFAVSAKRLLEGDPELTASTPSTLWDHLREQDK